MRRVALLAALALGLGAGCRRRSSVPARSDASPVVIVTADPALPPGVVALTETEPNDNPSSASVIDLGPGARVAVRSALSSAVDVDCLQFRFAAASYPSRLHVELLPSSGVGLRASVGAGVQSGAVIEGKGPGAKVAFPNLVAASGGTIVIQVRAAGTLPAPSEAGHPYLVFARLLPLGGGDEREPNDTLGTATALPRLAKRPEVAGFLAPVGDVDVFRLPLGEGVPLDLVLDAPPGLSAEVEVLDGRGLRLAVARTRKVGLVQLRATLPSVPDGGSLNRGQDAGVPEPSAYVRIRALGAGSDSDRQYTLRLGAAPM